jgi:multiple sugar transport system substrate-binding protein
MAFRQREEVRLMFSEPLTENQGQWASALRRVLRRRDFVRAAVIAGGLPLLAACAPSPQPAPTGAPAAPTSPPAAPTSAPAATPTTAPAPAATAPATTAAATQAAFQPQNVKKGITLNVAVSSGWEDTVRAMQPEFEQETGNKLQIFAFGWPQINEKVNLALSGHTGEFDVVFWHGLGAQALIQSNFVLPIDEMLKDPGLTPPDYDYNDIAPNVQRWMTGLVDNKVYGIGHSVEVFTLFYRKDLVSKPPETFDELATIAKDLTKGNQYGWATPGGKGEHICSTWSTFLWSWGGRYFDQQWNPTLNSPEGEAALDFYYNLQRSSAPPEVGSWGNEETVAAMQQGVVAMVQMWPGFGGAMDNPSASTVVGKVAYAPMPKGPSGQAVPRFGMWGQMVASDTKNPREAFYWLVWSTTKDKFLRFWAPSPPGTGNPSRLSTFKNEQLAAKFPWWPANLAAIERGRERPSIPEWEQYTTAIGDDLNAGLLGGEKAKPVLDRAASDVRNILDKAGYYKEGHPPYRGTS